MTHQRMWTGSPADGSVWATEIHFLIKAITSGFRVIQLNSCGFEGFSCKALIGYFQIAGHRQNNQKSCHFWHPLQQRAALFLVKVAECFHMCWRALQHKNLCGSQDIKEISHPCPACFATGTMQVAHVALLRRNLACQWPKFWQESCANCTPSQRFACNRFLQFSQPIRKQLWTTNIPFELHMLYTLRKETDCHGTWDVVVQCQFLFRSSSRNLVRKWCRLTMVWSVQQTKCMYLLQVMAKHLGAQHVKILYQMITSKPKSQSPCLGWCVQSLQGLFKIH